MSSQTIRIGKNMAAEIAHFRKEVNLINAPENLPSPYDESPLFHAARKEFGAIAGITSKEGEPALSDRQLLHMAMCWFNSELSSCLIVTGNDEQDAERIGNLRKFMMDHLIRN